jgi:hypothetical protein
MRFFCKSHYLDRPGCAPRGCPPASLYLGSASRNKRQATPRCRNFYSIRQQKGKKGPERPGAAVGMKVKSWTLSPSSLQPAGV